MPRPHDRFPLHTMICGASLVLAPLGGAYAACSDSPRPGLDWSGCMKLSKVLASYDLKGSSFVRADLTRSNFKDADLSGADFTKANLSRTILRGTNLKGAKLAGAFATRAYMDQAIFNNADLTKDGHILGKS